jgi:hypothetical protein
VRRDPDGPGPGGAGRRPPRLADRTDSEPVSLRLEARAPGRRRGAVAAVKSESGSERGGAAVPGTPGRAIAAAAAAGLLMIAAARAGVTKPAFCCWSRPTRRELELQ